MFNKVLRHSPAWSSIVSTLASPSGLNLRETTLESHDLSIPVPPPTTTNTTLHHQQRTLHIILLTPLDLHPDLHPTLLTRLNRFAALTGGVDIAIVFLLNTPLSPTASTPNATTTTTSIQTPNTSNMSTTPPLATPPPPPTAIIAYTHLQILLLTHPELHSIPIPILPLSKAQGLVQLVRSHLIALAKGGRVHPHPHPHPYSSNPGAATLSPTPPINPASHPHRHQHPLLPFCTLTPPLQPRAVAALSSAFPSLKELAAAAVSEGGRGVIAAALRGGGMADGDGGWDDDEEVDGVVEFWREEWVAE